MMERTPDSTTEAAEPAHGSSAVATLERPLERAARVVEAACPSWCEGHGDG